MVSTIPRTLRLVGLAFIALSLMACGAKIKTVRDAHPEWTLVRQAPLNPLAGKLKFVVEPLKFDGLWLEGQAETPFLASRSASWQALWAVDKQLMSDHFKSALSEAVRGILKLRRAGDVSATFTVRPSVHHITRGWSALSFGMPSHVTLTLQVFDQHGLAIDEVDIPVMIKATLGDGGVTVRTRLRMAAEQLGVATAQYLLLRSGAVQPGRHGLLSYPPAHVPAQSATGNRPGEPKSPKDQDDRLWDYDTPSSDVASSSVGEHSKQAPSALSRAPDPVLIRSRSQFMANFKSGTAVGATISSLYYSMTVEFGITMVPKDRGYLIFPFTFDLTGSVSTITLPVGFQYDVPLRVKGLFLTPRISIGYSLTTTPTVNSMGGPDTTVVHGGTVMLEAGLKYLLLSRVHVGVDCFSLPIRFSSTSATVGFRMLLYGGLNF